jgi:hypothetical protein
MERTPETGLFPALCKKIGYPVAARKVSCRDNGSGGYDNLLASPAGRMVTLGLAAKL